MAASRDKWPDVDAPMLQAVVDAFRKRSKAIRYQFRHLECTREFEESSRGTLERLNIDSRLLNSTMIRLSIWPDGCLWYRICRPGPRKAGGWEVNVSFFGDSKECGPLMLRDLFEKSGSLAYAATDNPSAAQNLEEIWKTVKPMGWQK